MHSVHINGIRLAPCTLLTCYIYKGSMMRIECIQHTLMILVSGLASDKFFMILQMIHFQYFLDHYALYALSAPDFLLVFNVKMLFYSMNQTLIP